MDFQQGTPLGLYEPIKRGRAQRVLFVLFQEPVGLNLP